MWTQRTQLKTPPRDRKKGAIVVLFVGSIIALLGMAGIALDGGMIYLEKVAMQAAADSGAKGAAHELVRGNNSLANNLRPAALNDIAMNGYTPSESTINVIYPPTSGPAANSANHVEVTISKNVPTMFLRVFGRRATTVNARALAGAIVMESSERGTPCILALHPTADDALRIHGTAGMDIECSIMSDSSSTQGLRASGSQDIYASWIGVAGFYRDDGTTGVIEPWPDEEVPVVGDPLVAFNGPSNWSSWPVGYYDKNTKTVVCPGGQCRFPSTLKTNQGSPGPRTLQKGIYVLQDGMQISGSDSHTGSEIFFYNVSSSTGIMIGGSGTFQVTPPTDGPYRGMLMYGDRSAVGVTNNIGRGSSTFKFKGVLYFPKQHLDWAGTSFGDAPWAYIISLTMDYAGTHQLVLGEPPTTGTPVGITTGDGTEAPQAMQEAFIVD